jgi:hypothetical protein
MEIIMLELTGKIVNIFKTQAGVGKDGKAYEARDKIQLMGEMPLPDGGIKLEMVDLSVEDVSPYVSLKDDRVRVSVGVMASGARSVTFYVRKGSKPVLA